MPRNLTTPDSAESSAVGNSNISGLKEQPTSSVSISVDTKAPGASSKAQYIPSPEKAMANAQAGGMTVDQGLYPGRIEKIHGSDYLSAAETMKRTKVTQSEIVELAKEIYAEEKMARGRYAKAKEIIKEASEQQLQDPDERLAKAMRIVKRGVKTKKDAKEAAHTQLSRQKRSSM